MRKMYFVEHATSELIALVPNVEELYLSQSQSTNSNLKCIGTYCSSLHTLVARSSCITLAGLKYLCKKNQRDEIQKNHHMKKLDIFHARIGVNEILFLLSNLPALEELCHEYIGVALVKIYRSHLSKNALGSLPRYSLRKLHVEMVYSTSYLSFGFVPELRERPRMKEIIEACFILCPQLSRISIHGHITQEELKVCAVIPKLSEIKFHFSISSSTDCTTFFESSLHSLVKVHFTLGIISIELLGKCCPKLEALVLESTRFEKMSEDDHESETLFPHLKLLHVKELQLLEITERAITFIINCSHQLEDLQMQNFHLSSSFVKAIQNSECLFGLKRLDLCYSHPCFPGIIELLPHLDSLEFLIMNGCNLLHQEYKKITTFLKTKFIHIEATGCFEDYISEVKETDDSSDYSLDDNDFLSD